MKNTSKTGRQQWLVVLAAIALVVVSVVSTLYFTGFLSVFFSGSDGRAERPYRNVTFTDAFLECDSYTRERYASRIHILTPDDHSSRFDNATQEYKIFFRLQMRKPSHAPLPQPYWVNCFVSTSDGEISHYQVGEAKDGSARPFGQERDGSGVFGWP